MTNQINKIYDSIIILLGKALEPFARVSMFLIYFWFGILKVLDTSPANPLVMQLQEKTLPFLSFSQFIWFFGIFEMLIGIMFFVPKLTKLTYVLFILHMGMTLMTFVFIPSMMWQSPFTPTLEGQYAIKNLALISLASYLLLNYHKNKNA